MWEIDCASESVYCPAAMRAGRVGGFAAILVGVLALSAWLTASTHAADGSCATPVAYPGDDAGWAALAQWMGHGARARGVPGELPVMAALESSGLRNLPAGDGDSVGFFQMRTAIWDRGTYAGFPDRPELQLKWFLDQAVAVRSRAVAAGDASFGKDPSSFGEWIADVERPAAQLRGRYQLRLAEARGLAACRDAPPPPATPGTPTTTPGGQAPPKTVSLRVVRVVTGGGTRTLRVVLLAPTRARAKLQLLQKGSPRLRRVVALSHGRTTLDLVLPSALAGGWYRLTVSFPGTTGLRPPAPRPILVPSSAP